YNTNTPHTRPHTHTHTHTHTKGREGKKSFSNQKVASSIPCRSVLEQDTEPLIAPDMQCAISVNLKCVYILVSRFGSKRLLNGNGNVLKLAQYATLIPTAHTQNHHNGRPTLPPSDKHSVHPYDH